MARWRWLSSTAWSKEQSSSKSKVRLIAHRWSKVRTVRPERRSSPLLPHFCAHRRPERNPTPGSLSTAKLVPFFAAADMDGRNLALFDAVREKSPAMHSCMRDLG